MKGVLAVVAFYDDDDDYHSDYFLKKEKVHSHNNNDCRHFGTVAMIYGSKTDADTRFLSSASNLKAGTSEEMIQET